MKNTSVILVHGAFADGSGWKTCSHGINNLISQEDAEGTNCFMICAFCAFLWQHD